ncbi:NAD(P)/FAD-dependent oxidoreductase [Rhodococcus rhodnii]|uniref:Oxidoreductase n=2 Tax=Rhodococcus rhodnii TaxID=38312 RepID=R7WR11_9NOCA|nr:NAD(P)-binding domain-containing protein [Rhodococcus rhodnii]EOM77730.1 oxidoreductase [Rhodococcus rhodnii LMG 5362]TXG89012.1 NAD(P)/FAD-dependent oxidoreductase [Rhodococcus rhodnii]
MTPQRTDVDVLVIGAGQAGLSAAFHLRRLGLSPGDGYVVLDHAPGPGGAWQFRWPSLTLSTVNGVHDLPGASFDEYADIGDLPGTVRASAAVPRYFGDYEERFALPVRRPVDVRVVCDRDGLLHAETDAGLYVARGVINATGTWERPFVPFHPGAARFAGRTLHTRDYRTPDEFAGARVVVVGGGISALQILDEVSRVADTLWVTRREPVFSDVPFTPEAGTAAVARVEDRVRRGLPPGSVVSVTGLPVTPAVRAARERGVLDRHPMFDEITEHGVRWPDGTEYEADVIIWNTGFRSALDHLAPLRLRGPGGGITMTGRLATQVARDARIHLVGYGPSASTIGANRAGRAAATELTRHLALPTRVGPPPVSDREKGSAGGSPRSALG